MNSSFEYISTLQYRLKAANDKLAAFETGEKYVQKKNIFWGIIRRLEARIKDLEAEVARAHAETVTVRNHWMEVIEDLNKECEKKLRKSQTALKRMEKRAMSAEEQRDDFKEKLKEERLEKYRLGEQLEEENCDLVRIRLT